MMVAGNATTGRLRTQNRDVLVNISTGRLDFSDTDLMSSTGRDLSAKGPIHRPQLKFNESLRTGPGIPQLPGDGIRRRFRPCLAGFIDITGKKWKSNQVPRSNHSRSGRPAAVPYRKSRYSKPMWYYTRTGSFW